MPIKTYLLGYKEFKFALDEMRHYRRERKREHYNEYRTILLF